MFLESSSEQEIEHERLESRGRHQTGIEKHKKNEDRKSFQGNLMHKSSEYQARGVEGLKNHPKAGDNLLRSIGRRIGMWVSPVG